MRCEELGSVKEKKKKSDYLVSRYLVGWLARFPVPPGAPTLAGFERQRSAERAADW